MKAWVGAARPKTLPAAAVPVILASSLAYEQGSFKLLPASIAFLFALLIQIATNFANDYYDYLRGADSMQRLGPKRATTAGWIAPLRMRNAAFVTLGVAFTVGLLLIPYGGWGLLIIGLLSIAFAIAYTGGPFPLAYLGLGDVFVLIFFGPVAVCTTYYLQTGDVTLASLFLGIGCGLLATNILVINNFRDADTDRLVGKNTTTVRFGRSFSVKQLFISSHIAILIPLLLAALGYGWGLLVVLLLVPFTLRLSIFLNTSTPAQANRLLQQAALILLVYGIIVSVALTL